MDVLNLIADHLTSKEIPYRHSGYSIYVAENRYGKNHHIFYDHDESLVVWQGEGSDLWDLCHIINLTEPDSLDQLTELVKP